MFMSVETLLQLLSQAFLVCVWTTSIVLEVRVYNHALCEGYGMRVCMVFKISCEPASPHPIGSPTILRLRAVESSGVGQGRERKAQGRGSDSHAGTLSLTVNVHTSHSIPAHAFTSCIGFA